MTHPTAFRAACTLMGLAALVSCGPASTPPSPATPGVGIEGEARYRASADEFTVMSYNMYRFQFDDRDNDGQPNEFKPDEEVNAVLDLVKAVSPDVLACIEMGETNALNRLRDGLHQRGLDYPNVEHLMRPDSHTHMAVLSRFPIVARAPITNETYTIGTNEFPVQRGFICADIQVNDHYTFRLMTAHLKSKRFSPFGQTEMRRNEGRLLNKNVRRMLEDNPALNLLVVGDLNDTPGSAAIREVIGKPHSLVDLRPADAFGDVWTHIFYPEDSYERLDYALVSTNMLREVSTGKCHVVRSPLTYQASDHRPVVSVFRARDL